MQLLISLKAITATKNGNLLNSPDLAFKVLLVPVTSHLTQMGSGPAINTDSLLTLYESCIVLYLKHNSCRFQIVSSLLSRNTQSQRTFILVDSFGTHRVEMRRFAPFIQKLFKPYFMWPSSDVCALL